MATLNFSHRNLMVVFLFLFSLQLNAQTDLQGKWYTLDGNNAYQELWISDSLAMSLLSAMDEMMTYHIQQSEEELDFQLIESNYLDKHEFSLEIVGMSEDMLQTRIMGNTKLNPNQTYYRITDKKPQIFPELSRNTKAMAEMKKRERKKIK